MPTQQSPSRTDFQGAPFDLTRLREELGKLHVHWDDPVGLTMREIVRILGVKRSRATELVKQAVEAGIMEMSGRRPMISIDGTVRLVPVYRLVPKG